MRGHKNVKEKVPVCWTNKLPASLGKQSNLQMEAYNSFEKEILSVKPLVNIITSQPNRGVKYLDIKMRIFFPLHTAISSVTEHNST
jgi:hypothetical protein